MTPDWTVEQLTRTHSIVALAPELVLTVAAMVVLLAAAFFPEGSQRRVLPFLALAGTAATAASTAVLWDKNLTFGPSATTLYAADDFALFFKWIFLIGLGVTILISGRFLNARSGDRHTVVGEYYALLMLSTVGMMMVAGARDLLVIFIGIETLSIALYILAGFARARLMSNEAALKYFLLGAFATGFLLYGIALIYYSTGSTSLTEIAANLANPNRGPNGAGLGGASSMAVLDVGLALLLVGLGFKAALVPFHQWTPDVYEGSPTPVTAFMAVGAKAAAFAALLRVFPGAFSAPEVAAQWYSIILVIAVLTMTVGNIVAISQTSLKRMLAYSSIAHAGYILIGVLATASAVINGSTEQAMRANAGVLFYLLVYALMNLGAFAVLVYLENARAEQSEAKDDPEWDSEDANIRIDELRGLAAKQPLAAAALTVFLLSLTGVPPLAGFFGKLFIFWEAMDQRLYGLLIVAVLNTVISAYYYLRPVVAMYMQDAGEATPAGGLAVTVGADGTATARATSGLSLAVIIAIVVCAIAVLAMIVLQTAALDWAEKAALFIPKPQ